MKKLIISFLFIGFVGAASAQTTPPTNNKSTVRDTTNKNRNYNQQSSSNNNAKGTVPRTTDSLGNTNRSNNTNTNTSNDSTGRDTSSNSSTNRDSLGLRTNSDTSSGNNRTDSLVQVQTPRDRLILLVQEPVPLLHQVLVTMAPDQTAPCKTRAQVTPLMQNKNQKQRLKQRMERK